MRIAQISTLSTPVRQIGAGSVEQLVWLLTRELMAMGHEVTVFGTAGSIVPGELVATLPGPYGQEGAPGDWELCEWINLCRAVEQAGRFDVLHSHAYLWGVPLTTLTKTPMLHTAHVMPQPDQSYLWSRYPGAHMSAISAFQWSAFGQHRPRAVIHHGIDSSQFSFRAEPEDYVCFLGRFLGGKGPLVAIEAARAAGIRLILAGPKNDYFRQHVEPRVDGDRVQYVGSVCGVERDRLLGGARALVYPVQAPEPFGLVLAEAMMCGTPVAAIARGAVPEIVDEGVTGICASSNDSLASAIERACVLDRAVVRAVAERRFSGQRMAQEYAQLYTALAS